MWFVENENDIFNGTYTVLNLQGEDSQDTVPITGLLLITPSVTELGWSRRVTFDSPGVRWDIQRCPPETLSH